MAKSPMGRLEMHADTRILIAFLRSKFVAAKSDFVSYADLTAAIGGRNVQTEARGLLATARRTINREDGVLLIAIQGEGIARETDLPAYLDKTKRHLGRLCRRRSDSAMNVLARNGVDNEQKLKAYADLSLLGAMQVLTQPKARRCIEAAMDTQLPALLPTTTALRAQFDGEKG